MLFYDNIQNRKSGNRVRDMIRNHLAADDSFFAQSGKAGNYGENKCIGSDFLL